MFSSPQTTFLTALLPAVVFGATTRNTSEPFQLYVYGKGLGGFPVFYSEGPCKAMISRTMFLKLTQAGLAYAGNPNASFPDDSNADVVQCKALVQVTRRLLTW